MTWTHDTPAASGWYWLQVLEPFGWYPNTSPKLNPGVAGWFARQPDDEPNAVYVDVGCSRVLEVNSEDPLSLSELAGVRCRWCGPLTWPETQ